MRGKSANIKNVHVRIGHRSSQAFAIKQTFYLNDILEVWHFQGLSPCGFIESEPTLTEIQDRFK